MKTPTHALIGYGCARLFGWRGRLKATVIIGAVAPDLPVAIVWSWIATAVTLRDGRLHQPAIQVEMDKIYFADTWLVMLHSLLHSPVCLAGLALLTWMVGQRYQPFRQLGFAFLLGALTHSLSDIVSHVTDGPLILWPLEDTLRLRGPFSHWDPAHGGLWISGMETLAGAVFCLVWLCKWARRRLNARTGDHGSGAAGIPARWRSPGDHRPLAEPASCFNQSTTVATAARSTAIGDRTIQ